MDELKSDELNHGEFQPEDTPRGPSVWRREVKTAVVVLGLAVLVIALIFWPIRKHRNPPQPMSPEEKARQMQAASALGIYDSNGRPVAQTKPDPDAFDEKRDGSHALYEEDEDGGSKIFGDKTSGARIFCATDSGPCLILPPIPATTKSDKDKGKTHGAKSNR